MDEAKFCISRPNSVTRCCSSLSPLVHVVIGVFETKFGCFDFIEMFEWNKSVGIKKIYDRRPEKCVAENHAWVHARDRLCTLACVLHGLWACRVAW